MNCRAFSKNPCMRGKSHPLHCYLFTLLLLSIIYVFPCHQSLGGRGIFNMRNGLSMCCAQGMYYISLQECFSAHCSEVNIQAPKKKCLHHYNHYYVISDISFNISQSIAIRIITTIIVTTITIWPSIRLLSLITSSFTFYCIKMQITKILNP